MDEPRARPLTRPARPASLSSVIKVKNIDFNPMPGAGAVDATVNEGTFYAGVLSAIKQARR